MIMHHVVVKKKVIPTLTYIVVDNMLGKQT